MSVRVFRYEVCVCVCIFVQIYPSIPPQLRYDKRSDFMRSTAGLISTIYLYTGYLTETKESNLCYFLLIVGLGKQMNLCLF